MSGRVNAFTRYRLRVAGKEFLLAGFFALGLVMTASELMQGLALPGSRAVLLVGTAVSAVLAAWLATQTLRSLRAYSVPLHGGGHATIRVGDFLDNVRQVAGASCAFGANDEFSVHGLRPDSAHAGFLVAFSSATDDASRQAEIDAAMSRCGVPVSAGGPAPGLRRYPYGTVVCQPFEVPGEGVERHAFLVANSTRQAHGFLAEQRDRADAVGKVFAFHRDHQVHSTTVVFSLMGSGHAHSHNPMQSVFHIIDTFMSERRLPGTTRRTIANLVVSVPERLVIDEGFDLEAVHLYLRSRARIELQQVA